MNIEQALGVLDVFGSDSDPIWCHEFQPGVIIPRDLEIHADLHRDARTVYITYAGRLGDQTRGTLSGMVADRMKDAV